MCLKAELQIITIFIFEIVSSLSPFWPNCLNFLADFTYLLLILFYLRYIFNSIDLNDLLVVTEVMHLMYSNF